MTVNQNLKSNSEGIIKCFIHSMLRLTVLEVTCGETYLSQEAQTPISSIWTK